ncbi:aminodeoxychorismate lyase [Aliiglaciecola sp. 3_MG-2023]|uniref:aminodeoxychorismate lyase n=1 Tax=Aliiglaciecola sp. 3_MG-2023 TaxID=3062644 RepID=UPI0026E227E3|nr:aminodeoxychorismate lyase [Aliiglaciecola sp. 3_MG-2023]MDO6692484.1 aminodeoxychorismate lyase [Aliiglaciecola sp. 3_MG-2023]
MIIELSSNDRLLSNDRISSYGDGCFTTMCVNHKKIELLTAHIGRLKAGCHRLKIDFEQWQELRERLQEIALKHEKHVIKVVVSRGFGGRGYGTAGVNTPHCYISLSEIPQQYASLTRTGLTLGLSSIQLAKQPLLAGIKHLNRLEQVLIKHEMQNMDVDDVIVCDTDSNIIECSAANLFWRKGNQWFTPNLDNSGVSGVMRNYIVEVFERHKVPLVVAEFKISSLLDSDEAFVCNSLMKVINVKSFDVNGQQMSLNSTENVFPDWFSAKQFEVVLNE